MKKQFTLAVTILISVITFAQNGINYKAIVKDDSGNVITNQQIQIQFSILKGTAQANVYTETHSPTTDANGLVILNIGEGTPVSGDFTSLDWGSDDYYLNVQLNTGVAGSSFIDLGTTQFTAVPYALQAEKASNVFSGNYDDLVDTPTIIEPKGLETIDEGNGIGWRLVGQDPNNYGNIGENAVDLSNSSNNSTTRGATGSSSTAMGFRTTALGAQSTTMGSYTEASGIYSTAMGYNTTASGNYSTAMGYRTTASGTGSTAMGSYSTASGDHSTAIGDNTIAASNNSLAIGNHNHDTNGASRLFIVGNGDFSAVSNAFTVYQGTDAELDTFNSGFDYWK